MTAISTLQFSPFRANFCRGWAKPLICIRTKSGQVNEDDPTNEDNLKNEDDQKTMTTKIKQYMPW